MIDVICSQAGAQRGQVSVQWCPTEAGRGSRTDAKAIKARRCLPQRQKHGPHNIYARSPVVALRPVKFVLVVSGTARRVEGLDDLRRT